MGSLLERYHAAVSALDEVQYVQDGIGHFPHLSGGPITHGFSWGPGSENMSFAYHEGDPDIIKERNRIFLGSLGMTDSHAVLVGSGKAPKLVDVNPDFIAALEDKDRNGVAVAHSLFTVLRHQPLAIRPADCSTAVVQGFTGEGVPLAGIIHGSRNELNAGFSRAGVEYCKAHYGCAPEDIRIGIVPSLRAERHRINREDVGRLVTVPAWDKHLTYDDEGNAYVDGAGMAISQFTAAGIPPENIAHYDVDTYASSATGEGFSHRYSTQHPGQRIGRFMVAVQIN
jgi:copper oxidase (laccase) domain-containing protein